MRHTAHFIEEFDSRADEGQESTIGRTISLALLEPDPKQPRSSMGDLTDLVASIREKGILEPILIRPIAKDDSRGATRAGAASYRIISGERRYRAAQEAGLSQVPVIEMDVTEQEALEIALIENLQRKDLTPFEEAEGYQALASAHGYTHEQISQAVGKSRSVITESLALLQMPARVRDIVQALGIHSKSVLLEVLKAESEEEMIFLLETVAEKGLNRDDLRRQFRRDRTQPAGGNRRRKQPYVFKFRAPDKTYSLALTFRQSTVERDDLIRALEQILTDLRTSQDNS